MEFQRGTPVVDASARSKLERAGTLHWVHWVVVLLSLGLTFGAYYFSKNQIQEKVRIQFEREADQAVELVLERMERYEDALWSGVGMIDALHGEISYEGWKTFSESIRLDVKYPGVNGIGVIYQVKPEGLEAFIKEQRELRPEFHVHPVHEVDDFWPITYIEPFVGNEKAVGLDMAHETNRYAAAKQARDTGLAQITGPIVLVQDAKKTPGFLFYAPFYAGGPKEEFAKRHEHFIGLVYAPFVMSKLMEGVLARQKRRIGLKISDTEEVLFDEHLADESDYDPEPLYTKHRDVELYGRTWSFDIRSAKSFRSASNSSQPTTILVGGIAIDSMLLLLFLFLSRGSRRALGYADDMTEELRAKAAELEKSNKELEQFAYVASHDLSEPLRKIQAFGGLLEHQLKDKLDQKSAEHLNYMTSSAQRLKQLIEDILSLSRITTKGRPFENVDLNEVVQAVVSDLEQRIEETGGKVEVATLPTLHADSSQMRQLFQNMIDNGLKYRRPGVAPLVKVSSAPVSRPGFDGYRIQVEDNGIGFDQQYAERIFQVFQRLHTRDKYDGTGIGLTVCEKIVLRHKGRIGVESTPEQGSVFWFELPSTSREHGDV